MKDLSQFNIENLSQDIKSIDNTLEILNYIMTIDLLSTQGKQIVQKNIDDLLNIQRNLHKLQMHFKNINIKTL